MKNKKLLFLSFLIFSMLWSCQNNTTENTNSTTNEIVGNPPAEGFDLENSDAKAIQIADEVMEAMGGRKAYDDTRYLLWDFFGSRNWIWDKQEGNIRVESLNADYKIVMNLNTMKGRVYMQGVEYTRPDSLNKYLGMAKDMWINDSYWLVMPYKLKDSGVTLKYNGEEKNEEGQMQDILELTFKDVGKTPENKYLVYVDQESKLVSAWSFFPTIENPKPRFTTPWDGYEKHGNILLGGGRGTYQLKGISVADTIAAGTFTEL